MARSIVVLLLCILVGTSAIAAELDYAALRQRARSEYRRGHFVEAKILFEAALAAPQLSDETDRAGILAELGDAYLNQEQWPEAEKAYNRALTIYRQQRDKDKTALLLRNLGAAYSLQRHDDAALRVLKEALQLARTSPASAPAVTAQVINTLGIVYYRQQKAGKAEALFLQALQIISPSGSPSDLQRSEVLNNLGAVYFVERKLQPAEKFLKEALTLTEAQVGPYHPDLTLTLTSLGLVYAETGRYAEAEAQYLRCLTILERSSADSDVRSARVLHTLSGIYTKAGRKPQAEEAFARAVMIARRNLVAHPDMWPILDEYSTFLKTSGKSEDAQQLRSEAARARATMSLTIRAHHLK